MHYPGMDFEPELLVDAFMDLAFKAWQAKMKGMKFARPENLKDANIQKKLNLVPSERMNKDLQQIVQNTLEMLAAVHIVFLLCK